MVALSCTRILEINLRREMILAKLMSSLPLAPVVLLKFRHSSVVGEGLGCVLANWRLCVLEARRLRWCNCVDVTSVACLHEAEGLEHAPSLALLVVKFHSVLNHYRWLYCVLSVELVC